MSRLAPAALLLAPLVALLPASDASAQSRSSRPARVERRTVTLVTRALKEDPVLVDEALSSDLEFRELAERYVPASRSRMAGGRALVSLGSISMILGAIIGASVFVNGDEGTGAAILGGTLGGGFALFVPGVALMATPSASEKAMRDYWEAHRDDLLRPEARRGPRLRLARGWTPPPAPCVRLLAVPF